MSLFDNYKFRCHSLGRLMSYLPDESIVNSLKFDIDKSQKEKRTLVNENGNKIKWTDRKEEDLSKKLIKLNRLQSGELSPGVISELDRIFNEVYWGRKFMLDTKEIRKGIKQEDSGIRLISEVVGIDFKKNETRFENKYLTGEPDAINRILIDNKCSYSLESFDNTKEPTNDNVWQIKGYLSLLRDNGIELEDSNVGYVFYTLVNNPIEEIFQGVSSLRWKHDVVDEDTASLDYFLDIAQLYSNLIYDVEEFKADHPNFDLDFPIKSIPKKRRVKKFEVRLEEKDIINIENRLELCLKYLRNKEIEENKYFD